MRRGSGAGKKHETPPPSPSKRPKRAVTEDDAVSALRESEGMAANLAKLAKFNERNSRSRSKGHAAAAVASFSQEPALQAPASQAPALQAPVTQAAARSIGELQGKSRGDRRRCRVKLSTSYGRLRPLIMWPCSCLTQRVQGVRRQLHLRARQTSRSTQLTCRLSEEAADTEVDILSHLTAAHKKSGEFMRDKAVTRLRKVPALVSDPGLTV